MLSYVKLSYNGYQLYISSVNTLQIKSIITGGFTRHAKPHIRVKRLKYLIFLTFLNNSIYFNCFISRASKYDVFLGSRFTNLVFLRRPPELNP